MGNKTQFNTNSTGSTVDSVYGKRTMRVYPIYEQEMNTLSHFNTIALIFFSIGSFFLSPLLEIILSNSISLESGNKSSLVIMILVAIAFYIGGSVCLFSRHNLIKKIKKESEKIDE